MFRVSPKGLDDVESRDFPSRTRPSVPAHHRAPSPHPLLYSVRRSRGSHPRASMKAWLPRRHTRTSGNSQTGSPRPSRLRYHMHLEVHRGGWRAACTCGRWSYSSARDMRVCRRGTKGRKQKSVHFTPERQRHRKGMGSPRLYYFNQ